MTVPGFWSVNDPRRLAQDLDKINCREALALGTVVSQGAAGSVGSPVTAGKTASFLNDIVVFFFFQWGRFLLRHGANVHCKGMT